MGFAVYRGQSAWNLWSTKSILRWICGLQRAVRVGFVVYEGKFAWDLRSTEGTKIQICLKYAEIIFYRGRTMVRILEVVRHFFLLRNVQTGCEAH